MTYLTIEQAFVAVVKDARHGAHVFFNEKGFEISRGSRNCSYIANKLITKSSEYFGFIKYSGAIDEGEIRQLLYDAQLYNSDR